MQIVIYLEFMSTSKVIRIHVSKQCRDENYLLCLTSETNFTLSFSFSYPSAPQIDTIEQLLWTLYTLLTRIIFNNLRCTWNIVKTCTLCLCELFEWLPSTCTSWVGSKSVNWTWKKWFHPNDRRGGPSLRWRRLLLRWNFAFRVKKVQRPARVSARGKIKDWV